MVLHFRRLFTVDVREYETDTTTAFPKVILWLPENFRFGVSTNLPVHIPILLKLQELIFMHDFEKNQLPNGLNWLFQRIGNVHNRLTRLSSARGLHTQKFNTTTHGLSSLRYSGSGGALYTPPWPFLHITH